MKFSEMSIGTIFSRVCCPKSLSANEILFQKVVPFEVNCPSVVLVQNCVSLDPSPFHINSNKKMTLHIDEHEDLLEVNVKGYNADEINHLISQRTFYPKLFFRSE